MFLQKPLTILITLQSTHLIWALPLGVIPFLQRENKGIEDLTDLCKHLPTERQREVCGVDILTSVLVL